MNKQDIELQLAMQDTNIRANHILHIILSILTAGIWLPVWFILAMNAASKRDNAKRKVDILMGDMI